MTGKSRQLYTNNTEIQEDKEDLYPEMIICIISTILYTQIHMCSAVLNHFLDSRFSSALGVN